jgi:hypothetical protein
MQIFILEENDGDMTETSDSGFTEINQSRISEGSQYDSKSGNASPNLNSLDENNSPATCENSTTDGSELKEQKIEEEEDESSASSTSSEDSDEDYDDSDQSGSEKKSVFNWVSGINQINSGGCVI